MESLLAVLAVVGTLGGALGATWLQQRAETQRAKAARADHLADAKRVAMAEFMAAVRDVETYRLFHDDEEEVGDDVEGAVMEMFRGLMQRLAAVEVLWPTQVATAALVVVKTVFEDDQGNYGTLIALVQQHLGLSSNEGLEPSTT